LSQLRSRFGLKSGMDGLMFDGAAEHSDQIPVLSR